MLGTHSSLCSSIHIFLPDVSAINVMLIVIDMRVFAAGGWIPPTSSSCILEPRHRPQQLSQGISKHEPRLMYYSRKATFTSNLFEILSVAELPRHPRVEQMMVKVTGQCFILLLWRVWPFRLLYLSHLVHLPPHQRTGTSSFGLPPMYMGSNTKLLA